MQRTSQGFRFCPAISGIGSLAVTASAALQEVRGGKILGMVDFINLNGVKKKCL